MNDTKPPRFFFDRRTLGVMETTQEVLDNMTIGGVSSAGGLAFMKEGWAAFLVFVGTIVLQLLKRGLASVVSRSVATNPINTNEHTTVSQPEPIVPLSTDPIVPHEDVQPTLTSQPS